MDWGTVTSVDWSSVIDCLAVVIGATTGALFALTRKLDIVGAVALALVAAYGGGILRDVLLHDKGFFFMQRPMLVVVCALIALIVFALGSKAQKLENGLFYADALSMAWFALAGSSKAWDADVGIVLTVVLGTITAVGGGALRDLCVGETPSIFKEGNFYALSGLAGAAFFVASSALNASLIVGSTGCVGIAFGLTWASRRFDWRTKPRRG